MSAEAPTTLPQYLTTPQLAELTHSTPEAVRQWRCRGIGPQGVKVGRRVLYPVANVMAWLQEKTSSDALAQRRAA